MINFILVFARKVRKNQYYFCSEVLLENIVSASILSADFCNLGRDTKNAADAGCGYIHFDIMDGVFVPNISYGFPVLKSVSKVTDKLMDVHLMITEPHRYIEILSSCGADIITVHTEAGSDVRETVKAIHSFGKKAGVAVKPKTSADELKPYLDEADMFLVMTVEPGFGGQGFIYEMTEKIALLKKMTEENGRYVPIEVDGGINADTAGLVKKAGAEILVAGSYLFGSADMKKAVDILRA